MQFSQVLQYSLCTGHGAGKPTVYLADVLLHEINCADASELLLKHINL